MRIRDIASLQSAKQIGFHGWTGPLKAAKRPRDMGPCGHVCTRLEP